MKQSRNTIARTEILNLISTSGVAMSHGEVQAKLNGLCDRVTIYRVLDRLTEEGLVHKVLNTDGVLKYAACHNCSSVHDHQHVHFSCEKCKTVTCLDKVRPVITLPAHYTIRDLNCTILGICPACG